MNLIVVPQMGQETANFFFSLMNRPNLSRFGSLIFLSVALLFSIFSMCVIFLFLSRFSC